MKKGGTFFLIIIIASLIGGLYGIIHDQLTYTISPEYYTKFKFYQFRLLELGNDAVFLFPRLQVSIVGFLATWWMGLLIGIILGFVGFIHKNSKQMLKVTLKAFVLTIVIAFVTGIIGLLYGYFFLAKTGVSWHLPDNLIDTKSFIMVGSMHNFSYLGGLIGLIAGIIYSVKQKKEEQIRKRIPPLIPF